MGWIEDNSSRTERLAQMAAQTIAIHGRVNEMNQALNEIDLSGFVGGMLQLYGHSTTDEALRESASALPNGQAHRFLDWLERNRHYTQGTDFVAIIAGAFGVEKAWTQFPTLPARMDIGEMCSALFREEFAYSKSLLAFFKNPRSPGAMHSEPIIQVSLLYEDSGQQPRRASPMPGGLELERTAARAASERIGMGGRFIIRIGCALPSLAVGIRSAALFEGVIGSWDRDGYMRAEHEARITRLQAKYLELLFDGVRTFQQSLVKVQNLRRSVEEITDPRTKAKRVTEINTQCKVLGDQLFAKLQRITYDRAWDVLDEEDRKARAYLGEEPSKNQMMQIMMDVMEEQRKLERTD